MIRTTAQDLENRIWLFRRNNLPELRIRHCYSLGTEFTLEMLEHVVKLAAGKEALYHAFGVQQPKLS
jgi:hypothetical protein